MSTLQCEKCSQPQFEPVSSNRLAIPTSTGLTLGGCITRPDAAGKFPALVWYDPYRSAAHGDGGWLADYFARRGYVFVYLHSRGSGNSQGVARDEYMVEETQEGVDALAWLASQPWCTGHTGMLGASYSGFTALQVAAEAPPSLKAIAPAYFTDRRYTDDCHYKGGCLRGYYDMITYGLSMVAMNALPPFPQAVGEQWSDLWQQRLEQSEPYLLKWISHPLEDDYWKVGSIAGKVEQVNAATLLIGGWHDGYVNPPLRLFRQLTSPRKLLMGPWSHSYPNVSHCGPRIDIAFELLRWFDHWLKGVDTHIEHEPAVQVFEQHFEEPITSRTTIAGRWRMSDDLPDPDAASTFTLGAASDSDVSASPYMMIERKSHDIAMPAGSSTVPYLPAATRNAGLWDAGVPFTLAGEQSEDSARAINFQTPPLDQPRCIFGNPTFDLSISSDVEVIPVAVRLLDIAPDGTKVLVTKGILNTTRRAGMDQAIPLQPGEITPIGFHMEATAWRFDAGHRIGVSINGADFPNVWPTPKPGRITVHWGGEHPSSITLPDWSGGDDPAFDFRPSPDAPRHTGEGTQPWRIVHDVLEDTYRFHFRGDEGEMGVSHRNPANAWTRARKVQSIDWPGLAIRSEAEGSLTSHEDTFIMNISLNVYLNDQPHFSRQWSTTVPRMLL